jgi:hypothetical protein
MNSLGFGNPVEKSVWSTGKSLPAVEKIPNDHLSERKSTDIHRVW